MRPSPIRAEYQGMAKPRKASNTATAATADAMPITVAR